MIRFFKLFITLSVLVFISSCASVDFEYPKSESFVLEDTLDTYFGKALEGVAASHPEGESGFIPLIDGIDALSVRLLMAERAEKSIDAQYYLVKSDTVGLAFIRALLAAADRGVRVRLLVDDMFTGGADAGMAALTSHPNFEIRVFNPFASRSARALDAITSFSRINRRMHNKSFTIDNQVTLIGGRNIADEYFGAREDAKFGDLDVIGIGPVVDDVSAMFDTYWNHERAAPIAAFAKNLEDPAAELIGVRAALEMARQEISGSRYAEAVTDRVLEFIEDEDDADFIWAPYQLAVDSPDKNYKSKAQEVQSITTALRASLQSATKDMIIISPYFVPRQAGIDSLLEIRSRGIEVIIVTNSLAANNQLSVHSGYAPSRKPLLKGGVKIYEIRDDADISGSQFVASSGAKATLHTKAYIVDDNQVFIGSFNFDPRSANINTELGVIIHSEEMAETLLAMLNEAGNSSFEVFLNEKDQLRWRAEENGEEVIYDKEPHTSWGQRFIVGFMRMLPIKGQL